MTDKEKISPEIPKEDKNVGKRPVPEKNARDSKTLKKEPSTPNWSLRILLIISVFICGILAGIYFLPALKERLPVIAKWTGNAQPSNIAELKKTLDNQQAEIDSLNSASADFEIRLNQVSGATAESALRELEAKVIALEDKVMPNIEDAQSTVIAPVDSSQSARIDMLLSRMSQLEASFVPLSKGMIDAGRAEKERQALITENANLSEKVSLFENRLLNVEQLAAKDNSNILLNYKVAEIKRKLVSGLPYSAELDDIKAFSVAEGIQFTAAINSLSENALTGIPTPRKLKKGFVDLIPNIFSIEGLHEDASWWQRTLNKLKNMITVRKTADYSNDETVLDSLVVEIENKLETSNLESVLSLTSQLPETVQNLLGDWESDVKKWVESMTAINTLESLAVESLVAPTKSENVL